MSKDSREMKSSRPVFCAINLRRSQNQPLQLFHPSRNGQNFRLRHYMETILPFTLRANTCSIIQLCINNVQKWFSENGFRFSVSKTTWVHFYRQRIYTEPALHLDGQPILVKGEAKFLGVVFDSKLSFKNHLQYLRKKCLKSLNLLRVVGHTDWDADRATLLKLYRALVWSKLDYGSVVYDSAKKHVREPWTLYIIRAFVLPSGLSESRLLKS
ncbi:RNA-directed DNA polymerase from mobile element jockey [Plakobranchus ocellatus]|uniref:RNA-directed DNA polymerase from mobile element jockey n=1 Tax=Plakobranchus ocellatus TaxID=259542 RepID=A0AAV4B6L7_9GAST|nr:RNA-directed DNA polymerase from mobile element jockey [Plakobranchus ocellatus]